MSVAAVVLKALLSLKASPVNVRYPSNTRGEGGMAAKQTQVFASTGRPDRGCVCENLIKMMTLWKFP